MNKTIDIDTLFAAVRAHNVILELEKHERHEAVRKDFSRATKRVAACLEGLNALWTAWRDLLPVNSTHVDVLMRLDQYNSKPYGFVDRSESLFGLYSTGVHSIYVDVVDGGFTFKREVAPLPPDRFAEANIDVPDLVKCVERLADFLERDLSNIADAFVDRVERQCCCN